MEIAIGIAFLLVLVAGTVFWIAMLIDCAKNEPITGGEKAVSILIIILTRILGALVYYFARRRPRRFAAHRAQLERWRMANPIAK
jgi:predicted transporter